MHVSTDDRGKLQSSFARPMTFLSFLLCLSLGVYLSPPEGLQAQSTSGRIRIAHFASDVPSVDIWVQSKLLFPEVLGREVSRFRGLDASGNQRIELRASPSGMENIELASLEIPAGAALPRTILFSGEAGKFELRALPEAEMPAGVRDDQTAVRIVNLSTDLGAIDLKSESGNLVNLEGVEPNTVSGSAPIPRFSALPLRVEQHESHRLALELKDFRVPLPSDSQSGLDFGATIFLVGSKQADNLDGIVAYEPLELGNFPGQPIDPGGGQVEELPVRILHGLPNAERVEIEVDGRVLFELEHAEISAGLPAEFVDAGPVTLKVRDASNADILLETDISPRLSDTIIIAGTRDLPEAHLVPFELDLSTALEPFAFIRGLHFGSDSFRIEIESDAAIPVCDDLARTEIGDYVSHHPGRAEFFARNILNSEDLAAFDSFLDLYLWYSLYLIPSSSGQGHELVLVEDFDLTGGGQGPDPGNPGPGTPNPVNTFEYRILHAMPDRGEVEIRVDGRLIAQLEGADISAAVMPRSNPIHLEVRETQGDLIFDEMLELQGEILTIVLGGTAVEPSIHMLPLMLNEVLQIGGANTGKASLRVSHFHSEAETVDWKEEASDKQLATGQAFKDISEFSLVSAQDLELRVRETRSDAILGQESFLAEQGLVYSAILIPALEGPGNQILVFEEFDIGMLIGGGGGGGGSSGEAQMRMVNAASDVPSMDFAYDSLIAEEELGFAGASDYAKYTAETNTAKMAPSEGDVLTSPLAERAITLDRDEVYSLIAYGSSGRYGLLHLAHDHSDPPAGMSRLRLVHLADAEIPLSLTPEGRETLFESIGRLSASEYAQIDSGFINFSLRDAAGSELLAVEDVWIKPNTSYALYITGDPSGAPSEIRASLIREFEHSPQEVERTETVYLPSLSRE